MYHSVDILTVFTASSTVLNDSGLSGKLSGPLWEMLGNALTHQQAFWPLFWAASQSEVKPP